MPHSHIQEEHLNLDLQEGTYLSERISHFNPNMSLS
jgi:hypothetical protein